MHLLFETPEARCSFDSALPALVIEWKPVNISAAFRVILNRALATWQELNAQRAAGDPPLGWLADTGRFPALLPAEQEWLWDDWRPRMEASGVERVAFVMPATILSQMSINYYLARLGQPSQTHRLFATVDHARTWLAQRNPPARAVETPIGV